MRRGAVVSCKPSLLPDPRQAILFRVEWDRQRIVVILEGQDNGSDGDRGSTKAMGSDLGVWRSADRCTRTYRMRSGMWCLGRMDGGMRRGWDGWVNGWTDGWWS